MMEEIKIVKGDSSSIYKFSTKQVDTLDNSWEGSWAIADKLGEAPVLYGNLVKNEDIFNEDSLVGEDFRTTYKIFESNDTEKVIFNDNIIVGETATISGRMFTEGTDNTGAIIEIPEVDRYITVTIKGVFVNFSRTIRLKTDAQGNFSHDFNIGRTIKIPRNSFFIFQLMPLESQQLSVKNYVLSVEIRQRDTQGTIIFRREVLRAKLKVLEEGVL